MMNVAIQGTKNFINYNVFMRAMGVALSSINDDNEFNVYCAGPTQVNSFTSEFCNMSEQGLKQRGIKIKFFKVPSSYIRDNASAFDYFAFLSSPKEMPSSLVGYMDLMGVETGVFRY
jgi:hypothetical protein